MTGASESSDGVSAYYPVGFAPAWIFRHAPCGMFEFSQDRMLSANMALAKMLGFETPAALTAALSFCADFLASFQSERDDSHDNQTDSNVTRKKVTLSRKDHSEFAATITAEFRNKPPAGAPVCIGFVEDISLQQHLQDLEKAALLGRLTEGIAHDFNNMISATLIHLGLLQQDPLLNAAQKASLKALEEEAQRTVTLTRQLLTFNRRNSAPRPERLNLDDVVDGVWKMLQRILRKDITVQVKRSPSGSWVNADLGQMEQVVVQLCLLVRDSLPEGGKLILSTGTKRQDNSQTSPQGESELVWLSVASSRACMPGDQALEPIVRRSSREMVELDLIAVRSILQKHRGWIVMPEPVDQRSSFLVFLPAAPVQDPPIPDSSRGTQEVKGGSETILLVEDEPFLRRVSTTCLRKFGYAVLDASDGEEALKLWEQHAQNVDLLFSDMLLPGPYSGLDLARRMREDKPSLKLMISSGHRGDLGGLETDEEKIITHVVKPYTRAELATVVRECLDRDANNGSS